MKEKVDLSIFVSYCRKDTNQEYLELILDSIERLHKGKINFIFDVNQKAGDDLEHFMERIYSVSAILVFLTPEYKARINRKFESGVYTEFCMICDIFDEEDNDTPVIPIILSGNKKDSCPQIFANTLYCDLSQINVLRSKNKRLLITKNCKGLFDKELKKVQGAIEYAFVKKTKEFKENYTKLKNDLFMDRKGENLMNGKLKNDLKQLIIKTKNYNDVVEQKSYILMGRKGSGKTTIATAINSLDGNKYKCFCNVNVNQFSLTRLYHQSSIPKNKSDSTFVVSLHHIFDVAWDIFITLCCIKMLKFVHEKGDLSLEQEEKTKILFKFIDDLQGDEFEEEVSSNDSNTMVANPAIFTWAITSVYLTIDKLIEVSRTDTEADFYYDIESLNQGDKMKKEIIPQRIASALESVAGTCKKKFFITLDGFDRSFEDFRKETLHNIENSNDSWKRTNFENTFLSSFLQKVIAIKTKSSESYLFQNIDFCVMVPRDRLLSVRRSERDSYIYRGKYSEINWSGPELALMLRKRLEVINGFSYKAAGKRLSPFDSLNYVIEECYPDIPLYTTITVGSKEYKKHIFIDVLRHTFWRPRDILYYFAGIITLVDEFTKRSWKITDQSIGEVISGITDNVIKDEFIGEFQNYFTNIQDVVNAFSKSKQLISYRSLEEKLSNVPFIFIHDESDIYTVVDKVEILFEIGFVGIRLEEKLSKKYRLSVSDVFAFSYGRGFIEKIIQHGELNECEFIIHPIFCEYLDLDTSNQSLTLDFELDYLVSNEIMRSTFN